MRRVAWVLLALITSAYSAFAAAKVTIVLQFESSHSERSILEMKQELQALMQDSGVELSWRRIDELTASDSFPRLVVVKFRGRCELRAETPKISDGPIALAYTHTADGQVLPFTDVECDRIRGSLGAANSSELLLGRALARVLAHELHHIIGGTRHHTQHGLSRKSLSVRELIADHTSS